MKCRLKYILIIIFMFFITGCHNINDKSIPDILKGFNDSKTKSNTYHSGYKYYLPKQMNIQNYIECNDVIESDSNIYYLYVDLIGYHNKNEFKYKINNDAYFSAEITIGDKFGYVEINLQENGQYLIEIMFNYAKIEVMVEESSINIALNYAVAILNSITYNDSVIENLFGEDASSFQEEIYNIFEVKGNDDNYLQKVEDDESQVDDEIKDTDFVN